MRKENLLKARMKLSLKFLLLKEEIIGQKLKEFLALLRVLLKSLTKLYLSFSNDFPFA